jgi:hypothetical protein
VELGPFHYDVYRKAIDAEWDDAREELTWKYYTHYQFDVEKSIMPDDEIVTNLNMPFWGTVYAFKARGGDQALDMILPNVYPEDDPSRAATMAFTSRPVREHLFGYDGDPLLAFMNAMGMGIAAHYDGIIANYTSAEDARTRITQPDTIMTGFPHIADLHQYRRFLGEEYIYNIDPTNPGAKTKPWATLEDGAVVGSDGAAFPTPLHETDSPGLFVPSFYRPVNLEHQGALNFKSLHVLKFQIPDAMWASSATEPRNSNYFQDTYEGALNISSCVSAVPLVVTRPRFAGVSASMRDLVDIEGPADGDRVEDNNSYFYVEPHTGMTMNVVSASLLALHTQNIRLQYDDSLSAPAMPKEQARAVLEQARATHAPPRASPMAALFSDASAEPALSFAPGAAPALATLGSAGVQAAAQSLLAHETGVQAGDGDVVTKDLFPDMSEAFIPLFFANQTACIDDKGAHDLAATLNTVDTVINGTPIVAYTIGALLVLLALFFLARGRAGYKRYRNADLYFVGSDDTAGRFSRVDLTSIAAIDADSNDRVGSRFRAGSYDTIALGGRDRYAGSVTMDAASPSSMYAATSPSTRSSLLPDDK